MICWLFGHRPQYRSCTANRTEQYLARSQSSVFGGGGHKNLGGGTLTQPRPGKFGMRQRSGEYFDPNPVLSLREASHAKLTQGAAFKRNNTSLTRCWR